MLESCDVLANEIAAVCPGHPMAGAACQEEAAGEDGDTEQPVPLWWSKEDPASLGWLLSFETGNSIHLWPQVTKLVRWLNG